MNARTYAATVRRVLAQLVADRRTLALILAVPTALLTLLYFVYRDYPGAAALFNHVAVSMMAMLPMIVMFLVTSVTMLRERGSGTLERLWTTPLHRADLLLGYATAFTTIAVGQSLILCAVAAWFLDVAIAASWAWVILTALIDAFLGVAMGLFVSAFARTEFQAVQFLCGLLVARDQLPRALELCSNVLPMSWAVDAVGELTVSTTPTADFAADVGLLAAAGLAVLTIAALTVPRRTR